MHIIAVGYDFLTTTNGEGTIQDWALLEVIDPRSRSLIADCDFYSIDIDSNSGELSTAAENSLMVLGFPKQTKEIDRRFGSVSAMAQSNGLWRVSVEIFDGHSGGPVIMKSKAVGIVVKHAEGIQGSGIKMKLPQAEFIPVYSIMQAVGQDLRIPAPPRLQPILARLKNAEPKIDPAERWLFQKELQKLNGIESWRLQKELCSIQVTETFRFLTDYFGIIRHAALFVEAVIKCLPKEKRDEFLQAAISHSRSMATNEMAIISFAPLLDAIAETVERIPRSPNDVRAIQLASALSAEKMRLTSGIIALRAKQTDELLKRLNAEIADLAIHFKTGEKEVEITERKKLYRLAGELQKHEHLELVVSGHTDDTGRRDYNIELASERAVNTKSALVKMGVKKEKIVTRSYGEDRPRDRGFDAKSRAENRRVEFEVRSIAREALDSPKTGRN